jgi:hypothetical protein
VCRTGANCPQGAECPATLASRKACPLPDLKYPPEYWREIDRLEEWGSDTHHSVISFGLRGLKGVQRCVSGRSYVEF